MSRSLGRGSGTAAELERLGFLRRVEEPGPHRGVAVYAIEDWAWKHSKLVKQAEELEG